MHQTRQKYNKNKSDTSSNESEQINQEKSQAQNECNKLERQVFRWCKKYI